MESSEAIEYRSKRLGISVEEVREYQAITLEDAIIEFLPPYLHNEAYETLGLNSEDKTKEEKSASALSRLGINEFGPYFSETEEGRLWYECNKVDIQMASIFAQKASHNFLRATSNKGGFVPRKHKKRPKFNSTTI